MEEITKVTERKINDVADKAREGVDKARKQGLGIAEEAIENAKAKGEALWETAKDRGMDLLDDVESSGKQALKQARTFIQRNPAQALGCAALIGLIVGALIVPKNND